MVLYSQLHRQPPGTLPASARSLCISNSSLYTSMSLVPANPEADEHEAAPSVATPEHCFHAFDALYCALTGAQSVPPKFPDEK